MGKLHVGMAFCCVGHDFEASSNRVAIEGICPTLHFDGPGIPGLEMVGLPMVLNFFVGIYSEGVTSVRTVHVSCPSLDDAESWSCDAEFEHGQFFMRDFTLRFMIQRSGIQWFDVRVDNELLTRIPVRIEWNP